MHSMAITLVCLHMVRRDRARVIQSSVTGKIKVLSQECATSYLSGSVKASKNLEPEWSTRSY